MTSHLLFVCAANVCRSALMEAVFVDEEAGSDHPMELGVTSAGVSVRRPLPMCAVAAGLAGVDGERHVSQPVTREALEQAALIVVASREERAHLARMLPAARARTFTLKEAVTLASAGDPKRHSAEPDEGEVTLDSFAALLHQRRGRVPIESGSSRRRLFSRGDDPYDVADVHHENAKRHRTTLTEVASLTATLRGHLATYLRPTATV